jgi:hypothetical protein
MGFIVKGNSHGFSRHLKLDGAFGARLDPVLYERVFGAT